MKQLALAVLLFAAIPFAHAAPPSKEQVDRLLTVMDARTMLDGMFAQIDAMGRDMGAGLLGPNVTAEQRAKFERVMAQQSQAIRDTMTWDRLAPIYRNVYTSVFSAEEVQAMIDFYAGPHGRSIRDKMPQAMARTMQEMQPLTQQMIQQMQQTLEREFKPGAPAQGASAK